MSPATARPGRGRSCDPYGGPPRGHPWHVHASFDKHGVLQPVASSGDPPLAPYGMRNWDFHSQAEAIRVFGERLRARLDHGYQIARARLPETPAE